RGEPVRIEERRDGWARVVTAYDYPGWVREEALAQSDGDAVDEARAYLGAPYLWGGMTERGIDCSGLVHMAYRRLGRLVPRDADQQEDAAVVVGEDELQPGDLVTYGDPVDHVAFWLGGGRILHSTGREDGIGVVNEEAARLGCERTEVRRPMLADGPENLTCARDLARGLAAIEEERVLDALGRAHDSELPLLLDGRDVRVKTGELWPRVYHEVAL